MRKCTTKHEVAAWCIQVGRNPTGILLLSVHQNPGERTDCAKDHRSLHPYFWAWPLTHGLFSRHSGLQRAWETALVICINYQDTRRGRIRTVALENYLHHTQLFQSAANTPDQHKLLAMFELPQQWKKAPSTRGFFQKCLYSRHRVS